MTVCSFISSAWTLFFIESAAQIKIKRIKTLYQWKVWWCAYHFSYGQYCKVKKITVNIEVFIANLSVEMLGFYPEMIKSPGALLKFVLFFKHYNKNVQVCISRVDVLVSFEFIDELGLTPAFSAMNPASPHQRSTGSPSSSSTNPQTPSTNINSPAPDPGFTSIPESAKIMLTILRHPA